VLFVFYIEYQQAKASLPNFMEAGTPENLR
jgi:hypothetical protein